MSERDQHLPAQTGGRELKVRDEYLTTPVRASLIGRVWSRFIARLNSKTIVANEEEVRAATRYANARGELADEALAADRKIAHYVHHRDDVIRDDDAAFQDEMERNKLQRELNARGRNEILRSTLADEDRASVQRHYVHKIAVETNEAALAEAQWQANRAKWGRDAFEQTMSARRKRVDALYESGALDCEIDRLIKEGLRDEELANARPARQPSSGGAATGGLDQLLAEVDAEIALAHATHASPDQLAALYAMKARVAAKIAAMKDSGG